MTREELIQGPSRVACESSKFSWKCLDGGGLICLFTRAIHLGILSQSAAPLLGLLLLAIQQVAVK